MDLQLKAADSHFSNGHILVGGFCAVGKKLVGNFTASCRLCVSEAIVQLVWPNGQSLWTTENCSSEC